MKRFVYIFIWLLLLITGTAKAQSAKQYFRAGENFSKALNHKDAIDQYSRAIELDPDLAKAYVSRASAYSAIGEHEKAALDYDRAIVFNAKDAELYYFSGNEWHEKGNNELALLRLSKAISIKGNFFEAYLVRSSVYTVLEQYEKALDDCKKCLRLKENAQTYYNLALAYEHLEMYDDAEDAYVKSIQKNRRLIETHYAYASLLYKRNKYAAASLAIAQVLDLDSKYLQGILLQSQILTAQGNYPKAIEVLSVASVYYPEEALIYIYRGDINQKIHQLNYAIIDYTRAIELNPDQAALYYKRAGAYKEIRDYEKALMDYEILLSMSRYDAEAQQLHEQVAQLIYELNREENKPRVVLTNPQSGDDNIIDVSREVKLLNITGTIEDESNVKTLQVNGFNVPVEPLETGFGFRTSVNLADADQIIVQVSDVYDNTETVIYPIRRTEVDPPVVHLVAPYGSADNVLYLDNNDPQIYVEGKIEDESLISSIYVESVLASYIPSDRNPTFMALVNVENKSRITVQVEDEYGNRTERVYRLNRDAQAFEDNPMGRTWAIFIENSDYESFPILHGPAKDVSMMRAALAKYQIHNTIHKKNMTKTDLQKFFSIELRDMIRSNRVKSVLIWYAGHGKYVNESAYWLPVDAVEDEEFSYYNINALKASMQSYPDFLTHTLVITDACASGPGFYQAMRSGLKERDCNDWESTRLKSAQVFSSAGYEEAADDSRFTRTFASVLVNNPNQCIPIEKIVEKVLAAHEKGNGQQPQFGKIVGMEDEGGTFFFIPKAY